jgi:hypothetical protein
VDDGAEKSVARSSTRRSDTANAGAPLHRSGSSRMWYRCVRSHRTATSRAAACRRRDDDEEKNRARPLHSSLG